MKKIVSILLILALVFCLVSCGDKKVETEAEETVSVNVLSSKDYKSASVVERYYYAMGYYAAKNYATYYSDINYSAFADGVNAVESSFQFSEEEVQDVIYDYYCIDTDAWLEENKKNAGVKVTESGLQYKVIKEGKGDTPTENDTIVVDYELTLTDGTVVDSTYENGEPAKLAVNNLIQGFTEAVLMMKEGSKYQLWIDPRLGYGEYDLGNIPAFSILCYTVELKSIVKD